MSKALSHLRRMTLPLRGRQPARLLALNTSRVVALPFIRSFSSTPGSKADVNYGYHWGRIDGRSAKALEPTWLKRQVLRQHRMRPLKIFADHPRWLDLEHSGFERISHDQARRRYLETWGTMLGEWPEQTFSLLRDPKRSDATRQADDAMWEAGRACRDLWGKQSSLANRMVLDEVERTVSWDEEVVKGSAAVGPKTQQQQEEWDLEDGWLDWGRLSSEENEKSRVAWAEWVKEIAAWKEAGASEPWVNDWEGKREMHAAFLFKTAWESCRDQMPRERTRKTMVLKYDKSRKP